MNPVDLLDDKRERLKLRLVRVERELGKLSARSSGRVSLTMERDDLLSELRETNASLKAANREKNHSGFPSAPVLNTSTGEVLGPTGRVIDVSKWARKAPDIVDVSLNADGEIPEGYAPMRNADYLRFVRIKARDGHDGPVARPFVRLTQS